MPCLASFFDAISCVKKLSKFLPAITYTASACNSSSNVLTKICPNNECVIHLNHYDSAIKNISGNVMNSFMQKKTFTKLRSKPYYTNILN